MKLIGKLVFHVLSNAVGIYLASKIIAGFYFGGTIIDIIIAGAILTGINLFVKPVLKLVFGPLIVITLGLFTIVLNMIMLYVLDIFVHAITIQGYLPLLYASLLIGIINFVITMGGKFTSKK